MRIPRRELIVEFAGTCKLAGLYSQITFLQQIIQLVHKKLPYQK